MKKQFLFLALALCLFAAAEMQGQNEPAAIVYVSGPATNAVVETHWGPACTLPTNAGQVAASGSQFRPTGIEFGGDGYLYFADDSNSEVGRVDLAGVPGENIEVLFSSSTSTLENPTDLIFANTDLIVSSRAGSTKSSAGLYRISRDVDGSFLPPEALLTIGSGGGSSAEALGMLFERTLLGTESSDDEVLSFPYPYGSAYGPVTPVFEQPLGIAAHGVGHDEVVYVAFSTTGQVKRFESVYDADVADGGDNDPNTFDFLREESTWNAITLPSGFKPRHLDTDLQGNLYIAASKRSNGREGKLFCVPYNFTGGGFPTTPSLDLSSAWGVAVAAGTEVTKTTAAGDALKLCGDEITLRTDTATFTAELTCRDITPAEFDDFVDEAEFDFDDDGFQDAFPECLQEPGKSSCTLIEISITGAPAGFDDTVVVDRIFVTFVDLNLGEDGIYGTSDDPADIIQDPGILYSHAGGSDSFSENILTVLEEALIDDIDPTRMTGSRDDFGSQLMFCEDCNGAPRIEPPLEDQVVTADPVTGTALVTIDATVLDLGPLTYQWSVLDGPGGNVAVPDIGLGEDLVDYELARGTHYLQLLVTDSAVRQRSSTDEVMIRVKDGMAPTISTVTAAPAVMWPPNHDFWPIDLTFTAADNLETPMCRVSAITHSENTNGTGDGDTDPDWDASYMGSDEFKYVDELTGGLTLTVLMRAERAEAGIGRTYDVTIECTDSDGNLAEITQEEVVSVEDNQSGG
jgi:hypothetical protein